MPYYFKLARGFGIGLVSKFPSEHCCPADFAPWLGSYDTHGINKNGNNTQLQFTATTDEHTNITLINNPIGQKLF